LGYLFDFYFPIQEEGKNTTVKSYGGLKKKENDK